MANSKISDLTSASTPLAGTETLPIVQSGATVKVPTNDLTVRNIRAAATTGILQVSGPTAGTTRTATVPDANWTAARTDAANTFTGVQTMTSPALTTPAITGATTGTGVATAATANTLVMRGAAGEITGAAGSFTAVNATGAVTLSSETANGVAYLNVSKVITSGSSFVFDGSNLVLGASSAIASGFFSLQYAGNANNGIVSNDTDAGGGSNNILLVRRNGSQVGSISSTPTATAYNTSSDYRLKRDIYPMTGALEKLQALNPVAYKWKLDGSDGQGFIAHELQATFPDCVTGKKDAIDKDGNPVYQGIDTSVLVSILVAAIKELQEKLKSANVHGF